MNKQQIKTIAIFIGIGLILGVIWGLGQYYGFLETGIEGPEEEIQNTQIIKQQIRNNNVINTKNHKNK